MKFQIVFLLTAYVYVSFGKDNSNQSPPTVDEDVDFGDIKLTPKQKFGVMLGLDMGGSNGNSFAALKGLNKRWTGAVIPYRFSCESDRKERIRESTRKAMAEWEAKTCIRFVKRTNERNYVQFYRGTGCWSMVGMLGGRQSLSIGSGCDYQHVMAHELGHVIGFYHEQNRIDRDEYVNVYYENILSGRERNFRLITNTDDMGSPYDYESIMHYPWNAFSKDRANKNTMSPKKDTQGKVPYVGVSDEDARQVSMMYNCPAIEKQRAEARKRRHVQNIKNRRDVNDDATTPPNPTVMTTENPNSRKYIGTGKFCRDTWETYCPREAAKGRCSTNEHMKKNCWRSCDYDFTKNECEKKMKKIDGDCANPLGLSVDIDGNKILPDSAFYSPISFATYGWTFPAASARLYNSDDHTNKKVGAWCASGHDQTKSEDGYVQVDLGQQKTIRYIATQGRPLFHEVISKFKIQYSDNGTNFTTYQNNVGEDKVFTGGCDPERPVLNEFTTPINGRFIRFRPIKWNFPCLRMELFGC